MKKQIILRKVSQKAVSVKAPISSPVFNTTIQFQVSGTVTDANGSPLPGASILEKGTTNGVQSDFDGNFSIELSDENATLVVSYIGFAEKEIVVNGQATVNVQLEESAQGLDEVVVVGYGVKKKATITGAISTVEGEEFDKSPVTNFSNSFAGRVSGLTVVTRSGEPGSDNSTIRIRGSNTLGDNSPLIVIDGIPNRDMNRLNPANIENITVLKDASAAIYGAQAANGVILITTKRGVEGKPEITVNVNTGLSSPTVLPNMADAATYAQMINELYAYDGIEPKYSEEDILRYRDGSDPWKYPNTDWYDETMKSEALMQTSSLELRGGSESLKYFVSVGTRYQDGIYKNSATSYNQTDFRSNLDGKISDNINLSIDISGRQENRNYPTRSAGTIFSMLMRSYPTTNAYWPNGLNGPDIANGNNPVVITTKQSGYNRIIDYVFQSNVKLNITFPWAKGLSFTGNVAYDKNIQNRKLWEKPWDLYTWDEETLDENDLPFLVKSQRGFPSPQLRQEMEDGKKVTINALLNYERSFSEKHNLGILLGSERLSGDQMNFWAFRKQFVSTTIDELFAGGENEKDNSGEASTSARLNYFGRVNYDFLNKYLFEFVWRYDGSYIFSEDQRFGFFPGVSLGWIASQENFWNNNLSFINYFKLRGSWGKTGNDRIDPYQFNSSYGFGTRNYVFGDEEKVLEELRVGNPNVTWEVANQFNIGLDGAIFESKLNFSMDYFYNYRTDILWQRNASVPQSTGLILPRENIGEVVNQGFDFLIGYNNSIGEFRYNLSLNGGYSNNHIKFWDETPGVPEYQRSTGRPMNAELNYNAIGVFEDQASLESYPHWEGAGPGDVIFEDVNEDGVIDGLDRVRSEKTEEPTFSGGLNMNLDWKNFYTSILFQWATGAERYSYVEFQGESGNYFAKDANGRWTEENPSATKARPWNRYFGYWRDQRNTYWLQNADYLRLKNLVIGYNLGGLEEVKKAGFEDFRIYFSGNNLITFDKLDDFDPESTSSNAYPLNKIYNLGISLTF
ncbi:TonB-dependent receptor [Pricia sp. S334]|uniref:TonB-dependent receptor n=1 Tax=Pricia mediterranea TaxID=3076079 RepID=A0ABU3L584_9FLAO|nr:TonB-dependent receptor [Pricia sp. S334]MDT7828267.1 TonB-dependent receptor [Pricia sp. S334]